MSEMKEASKVIPHKKGLLRKTVSAVTTPVKNTIDRIITPMTTPVKNTIRRSITASRQRAVIVSTKAGKFLDSTLNVSLATILIISFSVVLYLLFYYYYMPHDSHQTSVNLQFSPCSETPSMCSFPTATTQLRHNFLPGQRYSLSLLLELPDCPPNHELGMFLSCLSLRNNEGIIVSQACQSSMMRFRSELLRVIETIVMWPYLLMKSKSQRQWITVHYYYGFVDDIHNPAFSANVTIQSRFIQIYSSHLQVAADLSGLRHVMYHHSWISGFLGVSFIMAILTTLLIMSWSALFHERMVAVEDRRIQREGRRMAVEDMVIQDGDTDTDGEVSQEESE